MLPRSETLLHRRMVFSAVEWALDGDAGEGYTSLFSGFCRVKSLRDSGVPWAEELVIRYQRSLDEYAYLYAVARE